MAIIIRNIRQDYLKQKRIINVLFKITLEFKPNKNLLVNKFLNQ